MRQGFERRRGWRRTPTKCAICWRLPAVYGGRDRATAAQIGAMVTAEQEAELTKLVEDGPKVVADQHAANGQWRCRSAGSVGFGAVIPTDNRGSYF